MGCEFTCDHCHKVEPGIHVKDYIFAKPRNWFQRSLYQDGPRQGEKVEVKTLIACSRDCAHALKEKYPETELTLKVIKGGAIPPGEKAD